MSTTPTGGPSGPPQNPNPPVIEFVPTKKSDHRKLIIRTLAAIAAILTILWIRSRIVKISAVTSGWGDYQEALVIATIVILLIWFLPKMRKKWRERDRTAKWSRQWKFAWIVIAVCLVLYFFTPWAIRTWWPGATSNRQVLSANYTQDECDGYDELQNEVHHEHERIGRFVLKFHEACFPGRIHLPDAWAGKGWVYQPTGKNPDRGWWVAFWFDGKFRPEGPFFWFLGQKPWLGGGNTQVFQIQGKEGQEILFRCPAIEAELAKERKVDSTTGAVVTTASLISKVEPTYTEEARQAAIQGVVKMSLTVDENGETRDIKVTKSLGYGLDEQAVAALQKWQFQPGTKDGKPTPVEASVEMRFRRF